MSLLSRDIAVTAERIGRLGAHNGRLSGRWWSEPILPLCVVHRSRKAPPPQRRRGPEGPLVFHGGGAKPTSLLSVAEHRHDLADHGHEGADVILSGFNPVTTLGGV